MRRHLLWLELPLVLLVLSFAEFGAVLHELRTDVVLDWFISLAPLIWLNVSILVLYAFLRLYYTSESTGSSSGSALARASVFLIPNLHALRTQARELRRLWGGAAVAYAVAYMYLQGMIVVDPSGSIEPVFTVLESPVGYGPGIVWAPTTTFGILLRPYSIAAAATLSLLSGLVIALALRLFVASRRAATALPGPLLGFAVTCPACVGAPASGLILAYAAPFASMTGFEAASAFSRMLVLSTVLLIITLLLLWIVLGLLSNVALANIPAVTGQPRPGSS